MTWTTLGSSETMTPQEVFDKVATHLLKQGEQARRAARTISGQTASMCAYRGEVGKKCAIGSLIEDDEYGEWMEGAGVSDLLSPLCKETPRSLRDRLGEHQQLLLDLQGVHDGVMPSEWRDTLHNVACNRDLEWKFGKRR